MISGLINTVLGTFERPSLYSANHHSLRHADLDSRKTNSIGSIHRIKHIQNQLFSIVAKIYNLLADFVQNLKFGRMFQEENISFSLIIL